MNNENNQHENTSKKKSGPIRWGAVIPFVLLCILIGAYFTMFLDLHLKSTFEWAGYKALGVEVNIGQLKTSFSNASIQIKDIQITSSENPNLNSISIGEIRFGMSWDALLRAKILINETIVEQIAFNTQRAKKGKVAPPPPPPTPDNSPSAVAEAKDKALQKIQEKYQENVLGDLAGFLSGQQEKNSLNDFKTKLKSKQLIEKFDETLKTKQELIEKKIANLPKPKDFQDISDRASKIKIKDFKSVDELQTSLKSLEEISKDTDTKFKLVQSAQNEIGSNINDLKNGVNEIEKQISLDTKELETHFKLPNLDAKSLSYSIFNQYVAPYKNQFYHYKSLADKYIPPNLIKTKSGESDDTIKPHIRENGISYEFPKKNSYPLFWIKKVSISSQAGAAPNSGNIKGQILNITSNQKLISKPTEMHLEGDFPSSELYGLKSDLIINAIEPESVIKLSTSVKEYKTTPKDFTTNKDLSLKLEKSTGSLVLYTELKGLQKYNLSIENTFSKNEFLVSSENKNIEQIVKSIASELPQLNVNVKSEGVFPNVDLQINSNLGEELQKGLEKQIQNQINQLKQKITQSIEQEVGKQKSEIDKKVNALKVQTDSEVKKIQDQVDAQKKILTSKIDLAKKEFEGQGKKKVEQNIKKAADELKKKFGF